MAMKGKNLELNIKLEIIEVNNSSKSEMMWINSDSVYPIPKKRKYSI
jgi:hypothetical protein